ncbi:MAG: hypothetical protein GXX10_11610 [Clostridiaceae bacterium]|nr:hypothetical protein [Clostridiaceae bacterium]
MEELLKKIIEIEHQAQSLVAEGIAEKENMYKATRNEIENLKSNILEMSEHKIEELRLRNERDAEEKINQINESRTQKLKMLEETYNKNREQWENQIFTRIIGR